jgi:hypothetical protein
VSLALHLRVLWRFKLIVAIGFLGAVVLTFMSVAKVDLKTHKITPRGSQQWTSYARIFVTQPGFPYGAVNTGTADPTKFAANAILYSQLATSDKVTHLAFGPVKPLGTIQAAPVLASGNSSDALPIVSIAATADTKPKAMDMARRETDALISYVEQEQKQAKIPDDNRVVLQVIAQPLTAQLVKGRSKTLPIVVFSLIMFATVGLAFLLENLRPLPAAEDKATPLSIPPRSNVA